MWMHTFTLTLSFVIGIILGAITILWQQDSCPTARLLSPDGEVEAVLLEDRSQRFDRNLVVMLRNRRTDRSSIVFRSPDEGRPAGTERFVWSADGHYVLLLGRNFLVSHEGQLENGEQLYLLVRIEDGRVWANATQYHGDRFTTADVASKGFGNEIY